MVAVNAANSQYRNNKVGARVWVLSGLVSFTVIFFVWQIRPSSMRQAAYQTDEEEKRGHRPTTIAAIFDETPWKERNQMLSRIRKIRPNACGYSSGLYNLTEEELHPRAGTRHMVTPPVGGLLSLVCCETTQGNMAMVAHHKWAPLGAARFLEMVTDGYFEMNSTVPMFRCMEDFLCQFGLNSDPEKSEKFDPELEDDPNWLPEGPEHTENEDGVKRFARGYLAYAGAGPNTRGNQFIVSLVDEEELAGGSPWEVPWGELIGEESFETLSNFYTGYDDNGPDQEDLTERGMDEDLRKQFPKLDYINRCVLVDEQETEEIGM